MSNATPARAQRLGMNIIAERVNEILERSDHQHDDDDDDDDDDDKNHHHSLHHHHHHHHHEVCSNLRFACRKIPSDDRIVGFRMY